MDGSQIIKMVEDKILTEHDELWVCCLYYNNIQVNKAARHVEPTLVQLESKNPAHIAFTTVNSPRKSITLQSSTRLPKGMLHGFATEEECRAHYKKMCDEVEYQITEEKKRLDAISTKVQAFWTKNV